jgi:hypothetical protein
MNILPNVRLTAAAAVVAISVGVSIAIADEKAPEPESSQEAAAEAAATQSSLVAPVDGTGFAGATVKPQLVDQGSRLHVTGSLATVDIAREAALGFTLGALTVAPTSVDDNADAAQVVAGTSAVYGTTQPATNTIIRPTADGVETFEQLLDESAPSSSSWRVTTGDSEQLEQVSDATVAIVDTSTQAPKAATPPHRRAALTAASRRRRAPASSSPVAAPRSPPRRPRSPMARWSRSSQRRQPSTPPAAGYPPRSRRTPTPAP